MLKIYNVDASETTTDGNAGDSGMDAVLMAQADTGSDPAGTPPSDPSSSGGVPEISVIVPDADNRVTLAASASIEDIQLDGNDLLLVQPNGSQIRIIGGALSVPTFVIGDIELPQEVLVAALETSGFNVAAGPGNTLSVSPQAPTGSGGQFADSSDATIIDGQLQTLGLLGDDATNGGGDGAGDEIIESGNVASVLGGGVSVAEIVESVDNQGGVDADPVAATGSITFFDPDFGEIRTAEIAASNVVSQVLKSGGTLTAAQLDALLAGFSFDTPGGITVESTTTAGGSIDWTYAVGNEAVDFLAAGEVITLAFDVRINDGIFSVTQTVTVTVTGTNDQPVIEGTSVLAGTITEQTDTTGAPKSLTAEGQIVLSDVDVTDTHTASQSFVSAVWSGGTNPTADPGTLVVSALNQSADTADWTYAVADSALDFLSAGETLIITYDVIVQDDSETGTAASAVSQIVVTITGTNDAPVIDATAGASSSELVDSTLSLAAVTAFGQLTFTDVDLSDTGHSASVVGAVTRSGESDGLSILGIPLPDSILRAFLTIDAIAKPAGSADGSIDYSFSVPDLTFDYLAKGQSVTLTYTVELSDGDGGVTTQQVPITITGTNDRPEILFAATASGRENRNQTGSDAPETHNGIMLFFDADRDDVGHSADSVFAGATGVTAGLDISLIENAVSIGSVSKAINTQFGSLRWNFAAVDRAFDYLSAGQQVTLTYTVTLDDNEGEANSTTTSTVSVTITGTNDRPVIMSGAQTGSVEETADVVGGADPDPAAATGIISFLDVDLSDDPEASHDGGTVTNMSFAHGYTPTDEQIAALRAGFTLDDAAVANFSNTTGVGSTGWTYQVANDVVDFLGDGDSVELTYVVTIDDGKGGTVTQNVVVTVIGTSDAPTVSAADDFVVSEEDLTNGNSDALIFTGDVGLNFNDYSSVGLSARLKTSGAIPLDSAGDLILLSSDGLQLGYSLLTRPSAGQQILSGFNFRTGEIIFVLDVKIVADGSGGFKVEYTFELRGNLDHIGPGDGTSMPLDFTVTATNSAGETAENTFTVTINDDAPDAANVTATMEENTATLISLVEGDGADLDPGDTYISGADDVTVTLGTPTYSNLPAGVVPGAPGLSLVQTATGYDVSITPGTAFDALAEGESLLMEIPFTVEDGDGDTVTKVITVTVTGTNDQPVISAQTDVSEVVTETDAALSTTGSFDVSDADVTDVLTITGVTVAASGSGVNAAMPDSATLLALFGPSSGVAIDGLSSTGTVNWTFDAGSGLFDYLKAGESLELTYTVNVADGHGGTVEQDIAITIEGTNDAPVISPVTQPAAVAEAGDASAQDIAPVSGTLSVTDLDAGDTLTAQAGTPVISWSGGTLSAAQQSALMAALGTGALTLGTAVSNGGAAGIGYSWDPAAADLDFLAESQTLTVRYDVSVSDGSATSAAQPLIFTIAGTNDLPVARNDNPNGSLPEFRISEDATVARVFDVLGNDTLDVDAGSANNISLGTIRGYGVPGFASGGILDPLTSGFFTITVDVNNQIQVELNSSAWQSMRRGETAKIVIDYQLHGDGSDAATGSLQVEVTGSNDAPLLDAAVSPTMTQAEDAGLPSGNVGTLVSTLVSAPGGSVGNVNDVDGKTFAPGMSITAFDTSQGVWYYHLDGVNAPDGRPYWFNANLAPGQVLNLRAQDQLYFAPSADYVGTVDQAVTFRAWDGVASQLGKISAPGSVGGGTAYSAETDTVSLTVENVNDAPVLETTIADATVFANTALDIDVSGSFSDVDTGDVLSFSAMLAGGSALPAWLSIDATTGRLTGTPPSVGVAGETLEVVVTATDSGGLAASDTFELTIDSAPVAPVITAHTDGGVTEDASFAGGTNLITNGGFETGTTSGWSASNSYVSSYHYYVHSGVYGAGWTTFYTKDVPFTYSQSFGTVAGTTYTISFWVENKGFSSTGEIDNSVLVTWDGATVGSVIDLAYATGTSNFTEYSYTFTASSATSTLALAVTNNVGYTYIDDVSVVQLPGTETAAGTISFTDDDVGETHTVSFAPSAAGYFGTFSAALATESSGGSTGRVEWTFNVADADIQHLAAGETVSQIYTVTIDDGNGGTVSEDIEVVLTGADEAPILGTAGDDVLLGDAGAELLNGGSGSDILYGGGEADTFVFDDDALADAGANIRDLIADYDFAEGDVVDLSSLLGGETVVGHAADYVKMNGTFLEVDVDGTAGGAGFVRIAEFNDVPATNGLRILVDDDPADVTVVI
jgi:VCBS repeat-containing protein